MDADRTLAGGDDRPVLADFDIARFAADAAASADAQVELVGIAGIAASQVEGAVAAALADRLGKDAVAQRAAGADVAAMPQRDVAARARVAARAADIDHRRERAVARRRQRHVEHQVEAGIAAAAADRLYGHAVRFVAESADQARRLGLDAADHGVAARHRHVAGIAARAAGPADAERDRRALARDRAGHVDAALAAAAADRLDEDARRLADIVGRRKRDRAAGAGGHLGVDQHIAVAGESDVARIGAGAAGAAQARGERDAGELRLAGAGIVERRRDV